MKLVMFGVSVGSSAGSGDATFARGLVRALGRLGHRVTFFERNMPDRATHRDPLLFPGLSLVLYRSFADVAPEAARRSDEADAAIVISSCPDAALAGRRVLRSRARTKVFYELDAPLTLARVARGERPPQLDGDLASYDLVLSSAGGPSLVELGRRLGARRCVALHAGVDPSMLRPALPDKRFLADLSFLGAWAADRDAALERLLVAPARRTSRRPFIVGGARYPAARAWPPNLRHVEQVLPDQQAAFHCSSPLGLSITHEAGVAAGHCPPAQLFEAAACGVPVLSNRWPGIERFFRIGEEILVADTTDEVLSILARPRSDLVRVGQAARARVLSQHTSMHRAAQLLALLAPLASQAVLDDGEPHDPAARVVDASVAAGG